MIYSLRLAQSKSLTTFPTFSLLGMQWDSTGTGLLIVMVHAVLWNGVFSFLYGQ